LFKDEESFEIYFHIVTLDADMLYYNYLGIDRKIFPKWEGWKIIVQHKKEGTSIKDIDDPKLDILVRNFHYLKYLELTTLD
jgi:hypothetical protein